MIIYTLEETYRIMHEIDKNYTVLKPHTALLASNSIGRKERIWPLLFPTSILTGR